MQLGITTLGQQRVTLQGQPVSWPSRAAEALFYLLLTYPDGLSRNTISETLWSGGSSAAQVGTKFKVTFYRLRRALGDPGAIHEQEGRFSLAAAYYQSADHVQFQDELRRAKGGETRESRLHHTYRALSLYRGDFLPDCPTEWAEETRGALRAAYVRARLQAATLHCEGVECQSAVRNLAGALETDLLAGEQFHRTLMTCLCSLGRADDATSHYRHFLAYLQRDVGDLPAQATLRLAEQIRSGEPHAAPSIGSARPCARRLLYGALPVSAPPRPLDLSLWETEVRRGRQMLALMHKLTGVRGWPSLIHQVQGFLGTQVAAPYVWLVPHRLTLAPPFPPELEATGWPPPVIAAFRTALAGARDAAADGPAENVTVRPIRGHNGGRPHAWLAVGRAEGTPPFSPGDLEVLARVVDALTYVVSQARWAAPGQREPGVPDGLS